MVIYSFFHHIIDDFFLIDDQVPYTNTREIKTKEKDKMEELRNKQKEYFIQLEQDLKNQQLQT